MTHLSQFNESEIILEFFSGNNTGAFVDIGAASGVALSNTYELGLRGWHGLLVEPSPICFAQLVANYHHRAGFKLLNAAVWTERIVTQFNLNQTFFSSLIPNDDGRFIGNYFLSTVVAEDLKRIQEDCEFLSLDAEGSDLEIFPSLMEAYKDVKLICVEHSNKELTRLAWMDRFQHYGFTVLAETSENFLAEKK